MQMPPGTVQSNGNFAAKVQEYMEFLPDKQKKKKNKQTQGSPWTETVFSRTFQHYLLPVPWSCPSLSSTNYKHTL